jgi:hypothetical protein
MACLLNLLGESASNQVTFNAKSAGNRERVIRRGLLKPAHVPQSVRAVFSKGAIVKAHVVGLDRFGTHGSIMGKSE